mmetsp:Transcript_25147/g.63480  ORF Transcript_25147/g.63480 Transcript_25147/m.63480 type:complete len:208 (-) Transcript_25147:215-838(-)
MPRTRGPDNTEKQADSPPLYDWLRGFAPVLGGNIECGTHLEPCNSTATLGGKEASVPTFPSKPVGSGQNSPMSPAISAASTVSRGASSSLSVNEKRCASCDTVGDVEEVTCQICGENFPQLKFATNWQRNGSSMSLNMFAPPVTPRRLFDKEPPVPIDNVIREPMVWESTRMKFRTADGKSREVELPMLLNNIEVPRAKDGSEGRWM